MAQERLHVVPHGDGWAVKWEGKTDPESTHATQKEAIDSARDAAQNSETDLVVHRSDGTFRKVYSIVGEDDVSNRNTENDGRERRLATSDLLSVGTRISWGSVLAGVAVALTTIILMGVLATATGLSVQSRMNDRSLWYGAIICWIVTMLGAMFLGGLVVSRLTAGEDKTEAVTYGVVLWGTLFVFLALLTATGANTGINALAVRNEARPTLSKDFFEGMKLSEEQTTAIRDKLNEGAPRFDAATAAWWSFAGMLLSLGASIGGAITGAGPRLFIRQIRERRAAPAANSPATQSQSQLQTAGR